MRIVILLVSLIISNKLFSQDTIKFQHDEFWIDSQKITAKTTYLNNNGFSNEEYYYENGEKYMECTRINGELNGSFKKFYPGGQLKESYYYVLGFPAGDWLEFYINGNIKYHGSYIYAPDELEYSKAWGDTINKQPNELTIEYKISEYKEGCWKYYHPNGKTEHIEYYKKGTPIGVWYYYDVLGYLIKKVSHP
jgi:antitoxin component YwqK of YwqJK toxin-antitoxin module